MSAIDLSLDRDARDYMHQRLKRVRRTQKKMLDATDAALGCPGAVTYRVTVGIPEKEGDMVTARGRNLGTTLARAFRKYEKEGTLCQEISTEVWAAFPGVAEIELPDELWVLHSWKVLSEMPC